MMNRPYMVDDRLPFPEVVVPSFLCLVVILFKFSLHLLLFFVAPLVKQNDNSKLIVKANRIPCKTITITTKQTKIFVKSWAPSV